MQFECFYAFEELDEQGRRRWVFAIGDGPRTLINGQPDSIEFFNHYCQLAAAHGLSPEQACAPVTRKRVKELKELAAQARSEAERAPSNKAPPTGSKQRRNVPREQVEQPAGRSEPPRRRSRERGPARFTEGDVVRAIKAARKAGIEIAAVRIEPDGTILIIPGTPQPVGWNEPNDWD